MVLSLEAFVDQTSAPNMKLLLTNISGHFKVVSSLVVMVVGAGGGG